MKPHLAFAVENKLSEDPDAPKLKVDLNFKSMDDFAPENGGAPGETAAPAAGAARPAFAICAAACRATTSWKSCCANAVSDKDKLDKLKRRNGQGRVPMSDAQKSAAAPQAAGTGSRSRVCSTRSWKRAVWPGSGGARARQEPGEGVRSPGSRRRDDGIERCRGDDQRPHRADRSSGLASN